MKLQNWSRLEGSALWQSAARLYGGRPERPYHNMDHILRMYRHAAETYGFEYDLTLDRSILCHDVIIDGRADLERRSADWMNTQLKAADPAADALIMTTHHHRLSADNRLILLDLADFMDPEQSRINTALLRQEMLIFKGWNEVDFNKNTQKYLTHMHRSISEDLASICDPREMGWWTQILDGISETSARLCVQHPELEP